MKRLEVGTKVFGIHKTGPGLPDLELGELVCGIITEISSTEFISSSGSDFRLKKNYLYIIEGDNSGYLTSNEALEFNAGEFERLVSLFKTKERLIDMIKLIDKDMERLLYVEVARIDSITPEKWREIDYILYREFECTRENCNHWESKDCANCWESAISEPIKYHESRDLVSRLEDKLLNNPELFKKYNYWIEDQSIRKHGCVKRSFILTASAQTRVLAIFLALREG